MFRLQIVETSYKIKNELKLEVPQKNYMLRPRPSVTQKTRKIKLEPGVAIVNSFTSRAFFAKLEGKTKFTERIKPSPSYPIATSSIRMLPAGCKGKATRLKKKDFQCTYCFRIFQWKGSLNRHLRAHHNKNRLMCVYCRKCFKDRAHLLEHRRTHSTKKRHRCIICNKGFNQSSHMRRHLRIHSGCRPYKCTQCPKSFARASCLTGHIRTHTGERPYKCGRCSKAFTQNHNLRRHLRTHSIRPYQCMHCQKLFSQKSSLSRHLVLHQQVQPIAVKIESLLNSNSESLEPDHCKKLENTRLYNSASLRRKNKL